MVDTAAMNTTAKRLRKRALEISHESEKSAYPTAGMDAGLREEAGWLGKSAADSKIQGIEPADAGRRPLPLAFVISANLHRQQVSAAAGLVDEGDLEPMAWATPAVASTGGQAHACRCDNPSSPGADRD